MIAALHAVDPDVEQVSAQQSSVDESVALPASSFEGHLVGVILASEQMC
jgi:hypothetical protein